MEAPNSASARGMGRRGLTKVGDSGLQPGFRYGLSFSVLLLQQSRFLWLLAQKDALLACFSKQMAAFQASLRNFWPQKREAGAGGGTSNRR
jgi:hypothetical protein